MLVELAAVVPDGIVCFFVSYRYMDAIVSKWNDMGVLNVRLVLLLPCCCKVERWSTAAAFPGPQLQACCHCMSEVHVSHISAPTHAGADAAQAGVHRDNGRVGDDVGAGQLPPRVRLRPRRRLLLCCTGQGAHRRNHFLRSAHCKRHVRGRCCAPLYMLHSTTPLAMLTSHTVSPLGRGHKYRAG
jgi:hypothetical protein